MIYIICRVHWVWQWQPELVQTVQQHVSYEFLWKRVATERILKWAGGGRHRSGSKRLKIMFLVVPSTFLALKVQLVVLVSAFVMVSTVCSVSFLLFFYSRCPSCPAICKSGGHMPPVPYGVGATAGYVGHVFSWKFTIAWMRFGIRCSAWLFKLCTSICTDHSTTHLCLRCSVFPGGDTDGYCHIHSNDPS